MTESYEGFCAPVQNYFRMPNDWTDQTARMETWGEQKVVEYVLRHTWGFGEYGVRKHITVDEFMHGRKRDDGSRMDLGCAMGKKAVIDGLAKAVKHGFLTQHIDAHDAGRVRKYYALHMRSESPSQELPPDTTGVRSSNPCTEMLDEPDSIEESQGFDAGTSRVLQPNSPGTVIEQRTEKDTLERHLRNTGGVEARARPIEATTAPPAEILSACSVLRIPENTVEMPAILRATSKRPDLVGHFEQIADRTRLHFSAWQTFGEQRRIACFIRFVETEHPHAPPGRRARSSTVRLQSREVKSGALTEQLRATMTERAAAFFGRDREPANATT